MSDEKGQEKKMPVDTDNRPKRPTIHELEAILAETSVDRVVLNPDGSVSVLPPPIKLCMTHDQVAKTLCDDTTVSPTNWCVACRAYIQGYEEAEKHFKPSTTDHGEQEPQTTPRNRR